jgi:hypothetical protein
MANLRCYDPKGAGGGVHGWYASLPDNVQAAIDAALENIRDESDLDGLPQLKALRGVCDGLDEITIDLDKSAKYRILCFRGPNRGDLTLLFGFKKSPRGNIDYGPHCWSAIKRKEGVIHDGRRAPPCRFP